MSAKIRVEFEYIVCTRSVTDGEGKWYSRNGELHLCCWNDDGVRDTLESYLDTLGLHGTEIDGAEVVYVLLSHFELSENNP